jgi:cell division protein FtsZ
MFEISKEDQEKLLDGAKIKVVGIGGGGCNAVNTMIKAGLTGVEYIVANTDSQALAANHAPTKIQLGSDITKGLGAGANPEVGRKAALDEYEKLSEVLEGSDMVFITAGMGGGTGTGAAPVIAKLCKELGALTVGVVTKPFMFEGKKRSRQAEEGISVLEESVDSLITIPNQRLLYIAGESLSLVDTFKKADEVLLNAVRGISDLINNTGHINADFADVKTVMMNKGLALMGTGVATGPDRALKAANEAISSPLLEDITIDGATGIIINITGNESLTMHETNEAVTLIMEAADEDAEIIFGTVIDDTMEEDIKVTVVATGLGGLERATRAAMTQQTKAKIEYGHSREVSRITTTTPTEQETVTRAAPVREEVSFSRPEADVEEALQTERTNDTSSLINSIKDAAHRYAENDQEEKREVASRTSTRAKSIAEKLGFINFDEEELDTPTFLRKEESSEARREH